MPCTPVAEELAGVKTAAVTVANSGGMLVIPAQSAVNAAASAALCAAKSRCVKPPTVDLLP